MSKDLVFGFRCPLCTESSVIAYRPQEGEIFAAAGECGHCAILAEEQKDKLVFTVPCVTCPTPHRYTVGKAMLQREGGLVLQCAYSGVDCLFVGSREEVTEAMSASDEEILRILSLQERFQEETVEESLGIGQGAAAIDSSGCDEVEFYNPEIAADMLFLIKDMAFDQKIRCSCGNTEIDVKLAKESIDFFCPACGRSRSFATRSVSDRARLEELSEIVIH